MGSHRRGLEGTNRRARARVRAPRRALEGMTDDDRHTDSTSIIALYDDSVRISK